MFAGGKQCLRSDVLSESGLPLVFFSEIDEDKARGSAFSHRRGGGDKDTNRALRYLSTSIDPWVAGFHRCRQDALLNMNHRVFILFSPDLFVFIVFLVYLLFY